MAAEIKQIHLDPRRVRELNDEDAVPRNGADRPQVDIARQGVETVEDQPDIRVVRPPHDFPSIPMIVDMSAPGKRLVADAQAAPGRPLAQLPQIVGSAVDAAQCERGNAGTDEHQFRSKLLHHVELALRPVESTRPVRFRQTFEIAERLKKRHLQPVIADHAADLRRRTVEGQEIVLEYLHAIAA